MPQRALPPINPPSATVMTMCAICGDQITAANNSKEHIIPQSIGGRQTVRGFICRSCNSIRGKTWDATLASQYNWFAVMLNINRASKAPPAHRVQTANGNGYRILPGGTIIPDKPRIATEAAPTGGRISVTTRTMAEARRILNGIQRKHPEVDVEAALSSAVSSTSYLNEPVKATFEGFCGESGGRSIVKSAVAMAFKMGINPQVCDFALRYLTDSGATPAFAEFHLRDLVINRPASHLLNSVTVAGDTKKKRLTGYVEYFGITRVVVHLSQHYTGPNVHETYAFNPVTGLREHLSVDLDLTDQEYLLSLANEAQSDAGYTQAFAYAMPIISKSRHETVTKSVLNEAIKEAFEAMGVQLGEELPPERIPAFTACIIDKIRPYLMRMIDSRPAPRKP